jgi:hypothetical protein
MTLNKFSLLPTYQCNILGVSIQESPMTNVILSVTQGRIGYEASFESLARTNFRVEKFPINSLKIVINDIFRLF